MCCAHLWPGIEVFVWRTNIFIQNTFNNTGTIRSNSTTFNNTIQNNSTTFNNTIQNNSTTFNNTGIIRDINGTVIEMS